MGVEVVARLRQVHPPALVEAERHAQAFDLGPERIVVGVVPVAAVDRIGADEHRLEAQLVDSPSGLADRALDVVRRDHARPEHPAGAASAELRQPVVIGAGDGGGQGRVHPVGAQGEEAAAREQHGQIDALMIHGGHLGAAVPLPRLGLGVDVLLAGHQGRDGVGVAAVRQREDALAHLDAQVPGMTAQAPGRPVLERRVDIPFPQVGGLNDMHVRVHDLQAVFRHTMHLHSSGCASHT